MRWPTRVPNWRLPARVWRLPVLVGAIDVPDMRQSAREALRRSYKALQGSGGHLRALPLGLRNQQLTSGGIPAPPSAIRCS